MIKKIKLNKIKYIPVRLLPVNNPTDVIYRLTTE